MSHLSASKTYSWSNETLSLMDSPTYLTSTGCRSCATITRTLSATAASHTLTKYDWFMSSTAAMSTALVNSLLRSLALPNKSSMLTAGANLKYRLLSALRSSCLGASYLIKVRHNSLPDKFELILLGQLYHKLKSQACSRHPSEHRIQSSNICGDCKILISHQVLYISAQSEELSGLLLY